MINKASRVDSIYDVVIIGAGPAGSAAAASLAQSGGSTLLVERKSTIGEPIRCGELMRYDNLASILNVDGPWVTNIFNEYQVVVPDGTIIEYYKRNLGVLINRKLFEQELAKVAIQNGVTCLLSSECISYEYDEDANIHIVYVASSSQLYKVKCKYVIVADGVSSRIARMAKFDTSLPLIGMAATINAVVKSSKPLFKSCQLYFGKEVAPGGYVWVFPKSETQANLGIGVNARFTTNNRAITYLQNFIKKNYKNIIMENITCGGIPIYKPINKFYDSNVFVVGDAARQVNALTGSGIYASVQAGKMAAKAIINGDPLGYELDWHREFADLYNMAFIARRQLDKISDTALNEAGRLMKEKKAHISVNNSIYELIQTANKISQQAIV